MLWEGGRGGGGLLNLVVKFGQLLDQMKNISSETTIASCHYQHFVALTALLPFPFLYLYLIIQVLLGMLRIVFKTILLL